MRNLHVGRATWLLSLFVLVTPIFGLAGGHHHAQPVSDVAAADEPQESPEVASIVNRVIASENLYSVKMMGFSPRIETYVQYYQPDNELGDVATNDSTFLGRLKFDGEGKEISFVPTSTPDWFVRHNPTKVMGSKPHLQLNGFAMEALMVDEHNFDRKHYTFQPVRWEYLGDVRCLVIDVRPRANEEEGAFQGRIWVEDHDFAVVRLNGTRVRPAKGSFYVHFDCWRENLQPGEWLPVYVYSQETDLGKALRYKSETRLWGYDLTAHHGQQEWTTIQVDAPAPIQDNSEHTTDLSPVESARQMNMEAEQNVLDRLERARLIAPAGSVDKVLETVVNNLRVTNKLDGLPPVQCRVMMTSSLESFSLAYTIVLSRGLIDVLPDEASLAMVLSHELAHIALGHKLDPKYAFNDRLIVSDEDLLSHLDFTRPQTDEVAADAKGVEFLKNSPYKANLAQAGLFLRAAAEAAPRVPHMFGAHMGNGLTEGKDDVIRMSSLITAAPELKARNVDQISALPLGSRLQVNAWDGSVVFTDRKAVALVDAGEKMPFRVTPIIPYLRVYTQTSKSDVSAQNLAH